MAWAFILSIAFVAAIKQQLWLTKLILQTLHFILCSFVDLTWGFDAADIISINLLSVAWFDKSAGSIILFLSLFTAIKVTQFLM